jgi:hypothetical protein
MNSQRKESAVLLDSIPSNSAVTAMTLADDDRGLLPVEVEGKLHKRWIGPLNYWQCTVDGQIVDPNTIKLTN